MSLRPKVKNLSMSSCFVMEFVVADARMSMSLQYFWTLEASLIE